jgi:hypothetical protein
MIEEMVVRAKTHYHIQCFKKDGTLRWEEEFDNLVVTAGRNKLLDATFKTGLAAPAWYVGLVGATHIYDAGDILSSHVGWAENAHYTGNRKALTLGAISGGSVNNSASKAQFTIAGTANPDTIWGAFLCDAATGTVGTLYGAGDFAASRSVYDNDVLNAEVTLTITAA